MAGRDRVSVLEQPDLPNRPWLHWISMAETCAAGLSPSSSAEKVDRSRQPPADVRNAATGRLRSTARVAPTAWLGSDAEAGPRRRSVGTAVRSVDTTALPGEAARVLGAATAAVPGGDGAPPAAVVLDTPKKWLQD